MTEATWILDPTTGDLVVEGLTTEEALALADDLLPPGRSLNCARPLISMPLPTASQDGQPALRIARIYHGSVVDGPGRRSVAQLQGCPIRCPGCFVPETHDPSGGVSMTVDAVVEALMASVGEPLDGVTVSGGEPFAQPFSLLALLERLKDHGLHVTVYTGYTLEGLARRPEPEVQAVLALVDVLVDGPFVARLANGAGEWRGSRNQRLIHRLHEALRQMHKEGSRIE